MNKKIKTLIVAGGTGGHVFPGCNLAKDLIDNNYDVEIVTDKRAFKFLNKFKNLNISILPSTPIFEGNIFYKFYSLILIFYSIVRSIFHLIIRRPSIIFGMGGYASFPICIAASILGIKFIIYENNLIIGKANKFLLPFAKKVFVSYKELEGIPQKYSGKVIEIGNIINKEIFQFSNKKNEIANISKIKILVLGGSQAAKKFAEILPNIFNDCINKGISLKIYQQCLPDQIEKLKVFYERSKIEFETFNFSDNLVDYFSKVNLAITRSGSSMLSELTNANIPFISVPLPSSAENHQLKNAIYYKKKNFSFLIEEKDLQIKLFKLIKDIHENNSILFKIVQNQRHYSDKNVYNNINQALKKIINEKN